MRRRPRPGDGSGQLQRSRARPRPKALAKWLATDPTDQGTVGRELIIGDLNSYDKEDPIGALTAAGYTDLLLKYQGEEAYTYVFDGQLGLPRLRTRRPGARSRTSRAPTPWNINADEAPILDYNVNFKSASQIEEWFAPDAFRSSDHDPVIVGIDLDTVAADDHGHGVARADLAAEQQAA